MTEEKTKILFKERFKKWRAGVYRSSGPTECPAQIMTRIQRIHTKESLKFLNTGDKEKTLYSRKGVKRDHIQKIEYLNGFISLTSKLEQNQWSNAFKLWKTTISKLSNVRIKNTCSDVQYLEKCTPPQKTTRKRVPVKVRSKPGKRRMEYRKHDREHRRD